MPTPVHHLVIAQAIVADSWLTGAARQLIESQRGAFLLGSIAPDVQSVSRQPREATHFFKLPPTDARPGHAIMLAQHSALARAERLAPAHAAFIAGYVTHLALDELWIAQMFGPCFGMEAKWGTFRERLLIHNVLRTWLDERDQRRLDGRTSDLLARVEPQGWLPFVRDAGLRAWRDEIAEELAPGAIVRTAQVFAERLQVSPLELRRLLDSPAEMQQRVFARVPPGGVERFYADARAIGVQRVAEYVGGGLCV